MIDFITHPSKLVINGKEYYTATLYLDWLNNFLTIEAFAEHYSMPEETARALIDFEHKLNVLINTVKQ